ncbi:LOW QUALITY PROTEIN: hypothetical protein PanWU01x14_215220, partial [Parasponia andersonii]
HVKDPANFHGFQTKFEEASVKFILLSLLKSTTKKPAKAEATTRSHNFLASNFFITKPMCVKKTKPDMVITIPF